MSADAPNAPLRTRSIGQPLARLEGRAKVTGAARYAWEHDLEHPLNVYPVQATIARGSVASMNVEAARALAGVVAVITHENAAKIRSDEDKELWILQSGDIGFRGQFIGAVIAESLEIARHAADLVRVQYDQQPHDADFRPGRDDLYAPE